MPKFQCVQFGICPRADACEEIQIDEGVAFECARKDPKCREQLVEIHAKKGWKKVALIALPVVVVIALTAWWLNREPSQTSTSKSQTSVEQLLTDVWPWLK